MSSAVQFSHATAFRWQQFFIVIGALALVLLGGCARHDVLYGQVSERQANEMVALLQGAGIDASKQPHESGQYAVLAEHEHFGQAVALLNAGGYPRSDFDTVGQVFKKEGFISSPTEERARWMYALSQELANTLQSIDGVVVARVHLAAPEKDPLIDKPKPASASVFIKHKSGRDLSQQINQIKGIVVNGVEGLPYENVTVALFAAEPVAPLKLPNPNQRLVSWLLVLAAIGAASAGIGGAIWWWRTRGTLKTKAVVLAHRARPAKSA